MFDDESKARFVECGNDRAGGGTPPVNEPNSGADGAALATRRFTVAAGKDTERVKSPPNARGRRLAGVPGWVHVRIWATMDSDFCNSGDM